MRTAQKWLALLVAMGSLCILTGTLAFTYPETLGAVRAEVLWAHRVTGDLTIAILIAYVWIHLQTTWKMRRLLVSRRTGFLAVALWLVSAGSGVYAQFTELTPGTPLAYAHYAGSWGLILASFFHGAWGYARRSVNAG